MKKQLICLISLMMIASLILGVSIPVYAVKASDYGISAEFVESYSKDGKFYMKWGFYTGDSKCTYGARLDNASGKTVLTWKENPASEEEIMTKTYSMETAKLAKGKYTFVFYIKSNGYKFSWKRTVEIGGGSSSSLKLKSVENVYVSGKYQNKIIFSHSGIKGKTVEMSILDQDGYVIYYASGKKPVSYASGTYYFYWDGENTALGGKVGDGKYTIKFGIKGGTAKVVTQNFYFN